MGKPKTISKKAKKFAKKKGITVQASHDSSSNAKYSIDDLLDQAEHSVEEYNYEMAQKYLERALEINSDHPRALEMTASLLLEAGQVEQAKQCLGRAITVLPNQGHAKYFSLAQLFSGQESLDIYKQGILLLQDVLSQLDTDSNEAKDARKELSNSFCAVAELYMTDLCDKEEAEAECSRCVEKATEIDQTNPEAWQTKARLHLIKSEFKEAKETLNKSLDLWLPAYMAVLENRPQEASNFDPIEVCPLLFTTRLSTARMLIELEEWEKATNILNGLVEEDDEIVDPWYLLGWLNKVRQDTEKDDLYMGNARYYLTKAKEVHVKNPTQDKEMINHIKDLLNELGPDTENDIEGEILDDDDGWEELDEEEDNDEPGSDYVGENGNSMEQT